MNLRIAPFLAFASQAWVALASLLVIRLYSEFLDGEKFGALTLYLGLASLVEIVVSSAVMQATLQSFGGDRVRFRPDERQVYFDSATFSLLFTSLSTAAFFAVEIYLPDHTAWASTISMVLGLLGYLFADTARALKTGLLSCDQDVRGISVRTFVHTSASAIITLLFVYISRRPEAAIWGLAVSRVLANRFGLTALERPFVKRPTEYLKLYRLLATELHSLSLLGLIGWLSGFADRYILAATCSLRDAGQYSVAFGTASKPYNVLTASLTQIYRPSVYAEAQETPTKVLTNGANKWVRHAIFVGAGLTATLFVLAPVVSLIVIEKTAAGAVASLIPPLALAFAIATVIHVLDNSVMARNGNRFLLMIHVCFLPVSAGATLIGAIVGGAVGMSYARLGTESIRLALMTLMNYRHSRS